MIGIWHNAISTAKIHLSLPTKLLEDIHKADVLKNNRNFIYYFSYFRDSSLVFFEQLENHKKQL